MCRQCMDSGTRYGQRKKTKEVIAWAKKKRKHIRREELLAFLLDKPCPDLTPLNPTAPSVTDRLEDHLVDVMPLPPPPPAHHQRSLPPVPPGYIQGSCSMGFSSPIASPRRRALLRDETASWNNTNNGDAELFGINSRETTSSGRKRTASSSGSNNMFDFNMLGTECKRLRL